MISDYNKLKMCRLPTHRNRYIHFIMFPDKDADNSLTMISRLMFFISLRGLLNTISMSRRRKKNIDATYFGKKLIYCTKFHRTKKKPLIDCAETNQPTAMSRKIVKNFYSDRAVWKPFSIIQMLELQGNRNILVFVTVRLIKKHERLVITNYWWKRRRDNCCARICELRSD